MAKSWPEAPPMTIRTDAKYRATLRTSEGDIVADLFPEDAPITVNSFVFLARQGYYDGVPFHRVINGFMVQTGDPTGTGTGGPGYRFRDEMITKDYEPGTLAMANSGPHTNGSQFFICHADLKGRLPKSYTIFGKVRQGSDVVDRIASAPVGRSGSGEQSSPVNTITVNTVTMDEEAVDPTT